MGGFGNMIVLAVDPGTTESAYVLWDNGLRRIAAHGKVSNWEMLEVLTDACSPLNTHVTTHADAFVLEMVASFGMPVGREVFETVRWIGRYCERWYAYTGREPELMYRRGVKLHLCGSARAKDANVRQAVLDQFGGKENAVGKKAKPGVLYGIKGDCWSALAVALTYCAQAGVGRKVAG